MKNVIQGLSVLGPFKLHIYIYIVYVIEGAAYEILFTRNEQVRVFDTNNE